MSVPFAADKYVFEFDGISIRLPTPQKQWGWEGSEL